MTIKLSLKTCTVISAIIETSLREAQEKLFTTRVAVEFASNESFVHLIPKDVADKLPDIKEKLEEFEDHIRDFENALSELSEVVPDFAKIHECGKEITALVEKFRKAKKWSHEEKEAFLKICSYSAENREFIAAAHDELIEDKSKYLKKWEENNAGKHRDDAGK